MPMSRYLYIGSAHRLSASPDIPRSSSPILAPSQRRNPPPGRCMASRRPVRLECSTKLFPSRHPLAFANASTLHVASSRRWRRPISISPLRSTLRFLPTCWAKFEDDVVPHCPSHGRVALYTIASLAAGISAFPRSPYSLLSTTGFPEMASGDLSSIVSIAGNMPYLSLVVYPPVGSVASWNDPTWAFGHSVVMSYC